MPYHALTILSPGFEETEAITVIDILRRCKIEVTTAALTDSREVPGSHQITVMADELLSSIAPQDFNVLILPGGMRGVENMLANAHLREVISEMNRNEAILAAVCAAPLVYDSLGLIEGRKFTCHPCIWDRVSHPALDVPTVTDDRLITGRSAGCAMAWSLAIVQKLLGQLPDALINGLRLP